MFPQSSVEFENLHVMNPSVVDMEPQGRAYNVKTLDSGRSRIDNHHVAFHIPDYFEYMGMSAYEQIRPVTVYKLSCPRVITSRIAADMNHQHLQPLTFEEPVKRMGESETMVVTVAGDSQQRLERSNLAGKIKPSTEVSCMPYLVDRFQKITELLVEHTVSV